MSAGDEQGAGAIQTELVQPRGRFFVGRLNRRLSCAHGSLLWSEPGATPLGADRTARQPEAGQRRAWLLEAAARLREKTGCRCHLPDQEETPEAVAARKL